MKEKPIDASVELAFSMQMLQHYRRSGTLRATLHRIPGIQGKCQGIISFVDGVIKDCSLIDQRGQQRSITPEALLELNNRRGPFEWTFHSQASSIPQAPTSTLPPLPSVPEHPTNTPRPSSVSPPRGMLMVPRVNQPVPRHYLTLWQPQQRQMLQLLLATIDGQKSVQEIQALMPYPPLMVDELIQTLVSFKIIDFINQ